MAEQDLNSGKWLFTVVGLVIAGGLYYVKVNDDRASALYKSHYELAVEIATIKNRQQFVLENLSKIQRYELRISLLEERWYRISPHTGRAGEIPE